MRAEKVPTKDSAFRIIPGMPWRVAKVLPLEDYCFAVSFLDGTQGEVDMSELINSKQAGVFSALRDPEVFNQISIEYGAVTWPGEIDLAPDAMYQAIKNTGKWVLR